MPDLGVRCVSDDPWVTGAETCELVIALEAIGDRDKALELFEGIEFRATRRARTGPAGSS